MDALTVETLCATLGRVLVQAAVADPTPTGTVRILGPVTDAGLQKVLDANGGIIRVEVQATPPGYAAELQALAEVVAGGRPPQPERDPGGSYWSPEDTL